MTYNYLTAVQRQALVKTAERLLQEVNPSLFLYTFQNEEHMNKVRIKDKNLPDQAQIGLLYPNRPEEIMTFNYKGFRERSKKEQCDLLAIVQTLETLMHNIEAANQK